MWPGFIDKKHVGISIGIAMSHRLAPQDGQGGDRHLCFTDEETEIQRGTDQPKVTQMGPGWNREASYMIC